MIATYKLLEHVPNFEFFNWLVIAKSKGATEIVFETATPKIAKRDTYFGLENVMERFHSILEPGPALAGLSYRHGRDVAEVHADADLMQWVTSGNEFFRLKSVKPPTPCEFTVTIRDNQSGSARGRDSKRAAWEMFAEEIGAIIIDDYCHQKIHLHDRMALYAGAKMNFGVCNGPTHLITLTPYPVTIFVNSLSARGIATLPPEIKAPWMLANQHLVWRKDNIDNLRLTFDELLRANALS